METWGAEVHESKNVIVIYPHPCLRGSCTRIWGRHGDPPSSAGEQGRGNAHANPSWSIPGVLASVDAKRQCHQDLGQMLFIHVSQCTSCTKNHCFCSTRLSHFLYVFVPLVTKMAVFAAQDSREFLVLFLIRFAGQNYREISNLHFLSSKRGLCPQMP